MNLVDTLQIIVANMLIYSTPLIFTSIGGVFSERGGIVNVGLEGIMTMGAFGSVVFNLTTASTFGSMTPWLSILFGAFIGAIFASLHAVATVNLRADHIISGTVLNLMAPALGVFLVQVIYNQGQININQQIGYWNVPLLNKIPVIGQIFFSQTSLPAFLAIAVAFLAWYVLFKTRFGLRLRSVGENPQAADTLGINVYAYRWAGVVISGVLGGVGGAIYAQAISGNFSVSTIVGQGFISLAAMIFGKWNPIGAMLASLLFGLSTSLAVVGGQIPGIKEIPSTFLQMLPYVITIVVLALFLGKAVAPKADGTNYIKSK
ncbi:ABC transporter permease [Lactococcus fujiensis]|uniref:Nucleoside ABC transporter permease n=1 Tax=Lactococcus fujiensis JCM 16395 TaxID=1291764 RepID=A0A2A5RNS0_9LACT|nr:ABC transporter permease [Lactococcus fujiensis]PCS01012.1 nucleoside ABC transporter permease [Lactococcus fujiensis JCM 16395]